MLHGDVNKVSYLAERHAVFALCVKDAGFGEAEWKLEIISKNLELIMNQPNRMRDAIL